MPLKLPLLLPLLIEATTWPNDAVRQGVALSWPLLDRGLQVRLERRELAMLEPTELRPDSMSPTDKQSHKPRHTCALCLKLASKHDVCRLLC